MNEASERSTIGEILQVEDLSSAPSWPDAREARAAWVFIRTDPGATDEQRALARSRFSGLMKACVSEIHGGPRRRSRT